VSRGSATVQLLLIANVLRSKVYYSANYSVQIQSWRGFLSRAAACGSRRGAGAQWAVGRLADVETVPWTQFKDIDLASVASLTGDTSVGPVKYKPMAKGAEYMFEEEERQRSFGEHLVFYSGSSYLAGVGAGVALGTVEGMQKGLNLTTSKLRVNSVVNAVSKRAPVFGANLGVLALLFTTTERLSAYYRNADDTLNPVIGAASTGFLFKCTSGPRQCVLWTLAGGLGMGAAVLTGHAHTLLYRREFSEFTG
jgi:hypothetical protein